VVRKVKGWVNRLEGWGQRVVSLGKPYLNKHIGTYTILRFFLEYQSKHVSRLLGEFWALNIIGDLADAFYLAI